MYLRHWRKYWEQEKDRMVICQVQTVSLAGVSDHLAEYVSPEVYDSRYENGSFTASYLPEHWQLAVARDKKNNLRY